MRKYIFLFIRNIMNRIHFFKINKFYKMVMRINKYSNYSIEGETEWRKKWSICGFNPSLSQYRVFTHYVGNNIDIVPEDICREFIEPILNPPSTLGFYSDKNIFDRLLPNGYFPATILRRMNGFYYTKDYKQLKIEKDSDLIAILDNSGAKRIIIKPSVEGISGIGVQLYINIESGKWVKHGSGEQLNLNKLEETHGIDFIVQSAVDQNSYLSQFNPSSINTLRLSLYRSVIDNECHVTGAIMRIGGKGSVVDNAHAGGCYVGINKDGTFCHEVLDQYGRKRSSFNGIDFTNNFKYPNWENVIEFGKSVGNYIPHHRLLALDIALDKLGTPILLEFNISYYSMWLFQYTIGPAFDVYTDEILDYCKRNSDKIKYSYFY